MFRQPIVVESDTSLLDCLNAFQTKKTHMAFVTQHPVEFESYIGKCGAASRSSLTAGSTGTFAIFHLIERPVYKCVVVIAVSAVLTAEELALCPTGDYRLFPTMSPLVTIDGIITVEDIMEHLIGEEIEDETDFSHTAEFNNQVRSTDPLPCSACLLIFHCHE